MATNPFDEGSVSAVPAAIVSKVSGPAIALIVTGVLNVLSSIYQGINNLVFLMRGPDILQQNPQFQQMQKDMEAEGVPFDPAQMMQWVQRLGPVAILLALVMLALGVVIILGGLKMKQLQSYGLAMTAAIVAMIPCLSPCCIIGLPIGIWALVVLNNPEVKSAFR